MAKSLPTKSEFWRTNMLMETVYWNMDTLTTCLFLFFLWRSFKLKHEGPYYLSMANAGPNTK